MAGNKWYMTVGYPGGEFAFHDSQKLAKHIGFELGEYFGPMSNADGDGPRPCIRPCPPDLVEWLDAEYEHWPDGFADGAWVGVRKVPGGWLVSNGDSKGGPSMTFIPVAGAAGITILEDTNGG